MRNGTTRAGAQACQISRSIQKALHSSVASAKRAAVMSLGAMRSCRLEHTQQRKQSQSHLWLLTTNLKIRWWPGHLFCDNICHLTDYIADI